MQANKAMALTGQAAMSLIPHRGVILPVKKHLLWIERKAKAAQKPWGRELEERVCTKQQCNTDKCAESLHIAPTSPYLSSLPQSGKPPFKGEEGENTSATEPEQEDQEQEC
jgi:hypothetical protein